MAPLFSGSLIPVFALDLERDQIILSFASNFHRSNNQKQL